MDYEEKKYQATKFYAEAIEKRVVQHDLFSKEHGQHAIRSLFLLNGGAIGVILTFLAKSSDQSMNITDFVPSLMTYCVGLIFCVGANLMGYLNYQLFVHFQPSTSKLANDMIEHRGHWPSLHDDPRSNWIDRTMYLGIACGVISALLFLIGTYCAFSVFQ